MPLGSFTPLLMDTPWVPAYTSSNVDAFRWQADPESDPGEGSPKSFRVGFLEVRFLNGSVYQYYPASEQIYDDLFSATSKGKFMWQHVRDTIPFVRLS